MADDQNISIAKSLVREIRALLNPLATIFQDDAVRREVLLSLGAPILPGQPVTKMPDPQPTMTNLDDYLGKSDPDMAGFASALASIAALSAALEGFILAVVNKDGEEAVDAFISVMTISYLRNHQPLTYALMQASGIIADELLHFERFASALNVPFIGFGKLVTEMDADRYSNMILFPALLVVGITAVIANIEELRGAYGWEPSPGSASPNADMISDRMLYIAGKFEGEAKDGGGAEGLVSTTWALVPQDHQGKALVLGVGAGGKITLDLGEQWKLEIDPGRADFAIVFGGTAPPPAPPDHKISLKLARETEGQLKNRWELFNLPIGRLDFGDFGIEGEISAEDAGIELTIRDAKLVIYTSSRLFPTKEWSAAFNFGLGLSAKRGIYLGEGSELVVDLPISFAVGHSKSIEVQYITLGLKPLEEPESGFVLETSLSATFRMFKRLTATVQRLGLNTSVHLPQGGKGLDVKFDFKPPMGIGIELDLGFIVGGGFIFLDPENGSYAGILHIEFRYLPFGSMTAVSLLNEKLPDGTPITSFMLLISIRFPPYPAKPDVLGFHIDGFGFILGVNRTCDTGQLAAGVRNGTVDNILFPKDPIANAVRVVNDVRHVFPPSAGRMIFGGMIALGWGGGEESFIELDVGLLVEFNPDWIPARLVIMGTLEVKLPDKRLGIVSLHAAIAGGLDTGGIWVSGSIYDSHIGFMNISGDIVAFGQRGEHATFLFSAGGFHPAFDVSKLDVPDQFRQLLPPRRLTMEMSYFDIYRARIEYYLAVTTNSVQFGVKQELIIGVDEFNLYGFASFDALIAFDPFGFVVEFRAGLAVRIGSTPIMSVELIGTVSGPSPWFIQAKANFRIFVFSHSADVSFYIGEKQDATPLATNVQQLLLDELHRTANWEGRLPDNRSMLVTLADVVAPDHALVNPLGTLYVSQRSVPLGVKLDRFYNTRIDGPDWLDVTALRTVEGDLETERSQELFARGQFQNISDADKLSKPSFERMKSGLRASAAALLKVTQAITRDVVYEETIRDKTKRCRPRLSAMFEFDLLNLWSHSPAALSRLAGQKREHSPLVQPGVKVEQEGYVVVAADTLKIVAGAGDGLSYAEASTRFDQLQSSQPELTHKILVVPFAEAV